LDLCVEEHSPICNVDFGQLVSNKINNDGVFIVEKNFIPQIAIFKVALGIDTWSFKSKPLWFFWHIVGSISCLVGV
jgi:hypothetical protein